MADAVTTLDYILLGIVVGAVGQVARAAIGIQKARQEASEAELADGSWWDRRRLLTSIVIGGVAGALYVVVRFEAVVGAEVTRGILLSLVGVGYAGTDFIEGVLRRRAPDVAAEDGSGAEGTP